MPHLANWIRSGGSAAPPLAYCTIAVALAAAPTRSVAYGKEVWECYAETISPEPAQLLLRVSNGTKKGTLFATKKNGDRLIISGDLILNDPTNATVLYGQMFCDAHDGQFVNEVIVVGRLSKEAKVSDTQKSAARSVAVNRYNDGEELTDWFRLRGYGFSMDKLVGAPKGSLVSAHGCLEQKANREGNPYMEIKCRSVRVHSKGKAVAPNPAQGTSATGYDQEDFESSNNDMPFDWSK